MQLQEHLLRQVLCFVTMRKHAKCQAKHQALVIANQRGERESIAGAGSHQ